jgi:hypothetical protein
MTPARAALLVLLGPPARDLALAVAFTARGPFEALAIADVAWACDLCGAEAVRAVWCVGSRFGGGQGRLAVLIGLGLGLGLGLRLGFGGVLGSHDERIAFTRLIGLVVIV